MKGPIQITFWVSNAHQLTVCHGSIALQLWRGLSSYLTSQLQVDHESLPAKLTSNNLEHTLTLLEAGASLSYDSMMGVQSAAAEEEVGVIELNVDLFAGLLISEELLSTLDLRLSEGS